MKDTILIAFSFVLVSQTTARIIIRQDSVPIPQHVSVNLSETASHKPSIPNFQFSAFIGVVFLKHEKVTSLVGKNNLVHFGGEFHVRSQSAAITNRVALLNR